MGDARFCVRKVCIWDSSFSFVSLYHLSDPVCCNSRSCLILDFSDQLLPNMLSQPSLLFACVLRLALLAYSWPSLLQWLFSFPRVLLLLNSPWPSISHGSQFGYCLFPDCSVSPTPSHPRHSLTALSKADHPPHILLPCCAVHITLYNYLYNLFLLLKLASLTKKEVPWENFPFIVHKIYSLIQYRMLSALENIKGM